MYTFNEHVSASSPLAHPKMTKQPSKSILRAVVRDKSFYGL